MFLFQKSFSLILFLAVLLGANVPAVAGENFLPSSVRDILPVALAKVGSGTYTKFGLDVYRATLWAPNGVWEATKPYALELRYKRDVSKDMLTNTVIDDIKEQEVADAATMARWTKKIKQTLPAVKEDDVIIGLAIPGRKTLLFLNGQQIAGFGDPRLNKAFFNIWLGPGADKDLRNQLLNKESAE